MLNADSLNQLRALKQQIEDVRQNNTGTVKGSQGRFGFVVLDDGKEIYLPAEQMQRVFPDDRVIIEIITADDGKQSAVIESLVNSPLRDFTGFYVVRDNAHFVEPDLPRLSRWIFLPPKQRIPVRTDPDKRLPQHGDLVRARITRHPLTDGKPSARIEALIGTAQEPFIAARYALARFELQDGDLAFSNDDLLKPDLSARSDLTALPFVTIDGAETQDMDDALYAEPNGEGWRLHVAIADPTAWVKPGSALEQAIAKRANTVYLPGRTIAMLPEALANERCSLLAGEERLALVCTIDLDAQGSIAHSEFFEARICSQAKLSYDEVAAALLDETIAIAARENITALQTVATALRAQRARDHLLMPDRPDYRLQLDDSGNIRAIEIQHKTAAHLIVEECMVAANRCAADFLADAPALFVNHAGFRAERGEHIAQLIEKYLPANSNVDVTLDVTTLPGYIRLIQSLDRVAADSDHTELPPLRAIFSRWLERSQLSTTAAPHFGMGLARYATFTSPIRKYSDYLNHRAIKARLLGKTLPAMPSQQLTKMQEQLDRGRQAANLVEQWLKCVYLQKSEALTHRGTIAHINSSGFTVRLDDSGIEGFVDTRQLPEKYSFDAGTLRLSTGTRIYQLEQTIDVAVSAIDLKKRSINFQMVGNTAEATAAEI